MEEIAVVKITSGTNNQMRVTIPREITKRLRIKGGEKLKVSFDKLSGEIVYQKVAA